MNIMHNTKSQLARLFAVVALMLSVASSASAQDFYVITAGSTNYLAHNAALTGGLTNTTSFNATTCLWTISGSNIIAIAPDGTQGNKLGYSYSGGGWGGGARTYTLQLSASGGTYDWDNVTSSPSVSYSTGGWGGTTTVYLRYNSGWGMANENTHATVTKVTVTDAPYTAGSSTPSYTASLGGDGVIYSTSGTHTYTVDITQVVTYAQTRRTFGTFGTVTVDVPYAVSSAYSGALTDVSWSVSDNAYGATITSGGVLSVTSLPASVDNLTVTYTAQVAGQTVTATKQVTLMSAATYADAMDGGTTGVTTTTVTLNDYEPHEWAYYNKEYNSPIRSWNPANVKITYNGNGTNTVSTTDGATPATNSWTADASGVQVSYNETQHTFVYYKTLERVDGQTDDNPIGRCAYTTIPNPFSKRPVYNTGDARWRGFYAWRVKTLSGGTIHSAATGGTSYGVGSTINAETEIYFAPTSEYGMTVEFEALWARAYVKTGNANTLDANNTLSTNLNGGSYERNFFVITSGNTDNAINRAQNPVTISCRYPDGTTGGSLTSTIQNNFTANAVTKFEYVNFDATTFSANGIGLVVGRGCTGTITQINGSTGTGDLSYSIRLESATINNLHPTNKEAQTYTGTLSVRCTIGCDYDRANKDNEKVNIAPTNTLIEGGGGANTFSSASNRNNLTYDWYIKSGKIQANTSINTADPFYLGNYISGNDANQVQYMGKRRLTIEGGEMGTVAAGIGAYGNNYTNYTVNDNSWTVCIRMKGGTVNGSIYGAGVYTGASGDRRFVFTKGTIKGWVAGGCNGTRTDGGELYGESFIYVGGETHLDGTASTNVGSSNGGHVFGAGCGINGGTTVGRVNSSTIVIADQSQIARDVYGGGNYGYVRVGSGNKSDIYIMGGTVNGKVFGGSNQQQGQIVNISMTGGQVIGGVYGGSNASGTVAGPVNVTVSGGTVGTAGINPATSETGHVFGSGYGAGTSVTGNVQVTIGDASGSHKDFPLIHGNVYGGGFAAPYISNGNTFQVLGQNGLVKGSIFGGGKGNTAVVTGPTDVLIKGNIEVEGNVFGGGDAAAVTGNTSVKLQD